MSTEPRTANAALHQHKARLLAGLAELQQKIENLESGAALRPNDWGFAGEMGHLAEKVSELLS